MTASRYAQPIGLFLLAVVLLILKSPDALLAPQFWAEDGPVFFVSQFHETWPQLLTPYAGYLHTVTRLIAWLANLFDVFYAPVIYNTCALLIDAACIVYVTLRMKAWFPGWAIFASFFIVLSTCEIFGTATNVHWFMQFAIAAACFAPVDMGARRWPHALRIIGYAALVLAALSGPFSVMIAALAIGAKLIALRPGALGSATVGGMSNVLTAIGNVGTRLPKVSTTIVAVCACIQGWVLVGSSIRVPSGQMLLSTQQKVSLGVSHLEPFYFYSIIIPSDPLFYAALSCIAAVATACLIQAARSPSTWVGIACLLLAMGVVQPILAYVKSPFLVTVAITSRYCFFLCVVCCWIGARLLFNASPIWMRSAVVMVCIALVLGISLRPDYFRRRPFHDMAWKKYSDQLRRNDLSDVVVPINPVPWYFEVKSMPK